MEQSKIKEMVRRYGIFDAGDGRLGIREAILARKENAIEDIKTAKQEILAYFAAEKAEKQRAIEERRRKIEAIPGLKEVEAAKADLAAWHREFSASFDGEGAVGGLGVRPNPDYDFDALKAAYPAAFAYLAAEKEVEKENYELSAIGRKALEKIIECPEEWAKAIEEMDAAKKAFVDRHLWD